MEIDNAIGQKHFLVNPVSLKGATARFETGEAQILDISFLRVVVDDCEAVGNLNDGKFKVEFFLNPFRFTSEVVFRSQGTDWKRFDFERLVPSAHAHLRSFLSPKKVGESILQDVATDLTSHYHGLNETELWSDQKGGVLFTYLDPEEPQMQFLVRIGGDLNLRVGKISRADYMSLDSLDGEIPLIPLTDREMYSKLGECRDIITNFRPCGQGEYILKQKLLKAVSETLYSTGKRVEFTVPRPPKVVTLPVENQ